jgi:hypothetical protein
MASPAGIQAVADMTVEPMVVMVAVVMAVMATIAAAAALASESNAGSEHDQGGSDTKSSFTEHSHLL